MSTAEVLRRIARLRVTLGFPCGLAALWLARPTPQSLAIGAAFALFGEAFRVWAAGHLEKAREVTSSGPYAFTRHPLYIGSSLIGVGFALGSASLVVGIMVVVYLAVTLTAAVRTEEAHLTEKFGHAYAAYRDGRTPDVRRTFTFERAMRNREYRALIGLGVGMAVLAWKAGIVFS
jgi:steroid 5-alpha reductase family enzyme